MASDTLEHSPQALAAVPLPRTFVAGMASCFATVVLLLLLLVLLRSVSVTELDSLHVPSAVCVWN